MACRYDWIIFKTLNRPDYETRNSSLLHLDNPVHVYEVRRIKKHIYSNINQAYLKGRAQLNME